MAEEPSAVLPDDSPFKTGGIGNLGTAPSSWAMESCHTILILGSAIEAALNSPRDSLVEAWVDVNEKPARPDELRV